jgi:hypothetical protein
VFQICIEFADIFTFKKRSLRALGHSPESSLVLKATGNHLLISAVRHSTELAQRCGPLRNSVYAQRRPVSNQRIVRFYVSTCYLSMCTWLFIHVTWPYIHMHMAINLYGCLNLCAYGCVPCSSGCVSMVGFVLCAHDRLFRYTWLCIHMHKDTYPCACGHLSMWSCIYMQNLILRCGL